MTWDRLNVALALACCAGMAKADLIIGNMPGNDATQSASLQAGRIKGMAFTMPVGGGDYTLDNVVLRLNLTTTGVIPLVRIFDDVGGLPVNSLVTLDNPPITTTGIQSLTFTPPGPFVLADGVKYWIVVYNVGAVSMDWKASSPVQTPTGLAMHSGSLFSTTGGPNPPNAVSAIINNYEVNGTAGGGCYADCDTSTGVGVLDIFDFLCFGNRFSVGDPYACDCDTSTGLGVCDIFDFLCFGNAFNAGCP